jgi:hypothetical protein
LGNKNSAQKYPAVLTLEGGYSTELNLSQLDARRLSEELSRDFIPFPTLHNEESQLAEFDTGSMETDEMKYLARTKNLSSRMEAEKHNIGYWMELLDVQNLAKDSIFQGKSKLIIEKKLAIIERAFEESETLKQNLYLRLLRLDLLKETQNTEDMHLLVTREFESMQEDIKSDKGQVLILYLYFKHTHFFNYSSALLHHDTKLLLEDLGERLNDSMDTAEIKRLENMMFLAFVHSLILLLQMGYSEKAFGLITAMIDINVVKNTTKEKYLQDWDSDENEKCGDIDSSTNQHMQSFDITLLGSLGMKEPEFIDELFCKECDSLYEVCAKEKLYSQIFWRCAQPSSKLTTEENQLNHRRIEIDTFSAVIHEDIEDFIFQFYDSETKIKLIDLSLDLLGLPRLYFPQPIMESLTFHDFVRTTLLVETGKSSLRLFESLISSPHLWSFALTFSNLIEGVLRVDQISKFEHGRRIVSELLKKNPTSGILLYASFCIELLKSKSPIYQKISSTSETKLESGRIAVDGSFKTLLKGNQTNYRLWMAYIEVETFVPNEPEEGYQKFNQLVDKVTAAFKASDDNSSVRLGLIDILARLGQTTQVFQSELRLSILKSIISMSFEILTSLGIQTSQFTFGQQKSSSFDRNDEGANIQEDAFTFLAAQGTDFLNLSQILFKLYVTFMQLETSKEVKNFIDGSLLTKFQPFYTTDFCIVVVLWYLFSSLAGKPNLEELLIGMIQDWQRLQHTRWQKMTNTYLKQYKQEKLRVELKTMTMMVSNLANFFKIVLPTARMQLQIEFFSKIYTEILPRDNTALENIVRWTAENKYRFEWVDFAKKSGVRFCFSTLLSLLFSFKRFGSARCDENSLQVFNMYLLQQYSDKRFIDQLLEDLQADVTKINQLKGETKTKHFEGARGGLVHGQGEINSLNWFDSGMSIMLEARAHSIVQDSYGQLLKSNSSIVNQDKTKLFLLEMVDRNPASKNFYLEFLSLPSLSTAETSRVHSAMAEKELKVIYDLKDIINELDN